MALPDQNILTSLLIDFKGKIGPASANIFPYAQKILKILVTIDLTLAYIMSLIKDEDAGVKLLLQNVIKYGAFVYILSSYTTIVNSIIATFQFVGLTAAGGGISASDFTNPSLMCTKGLELTADLITNVGAGQTILNPFTALLVLLAAIAIIFAFFVIGLEIFIVNVEFSIVAALGLILIPFGVWDKTSFIFDKIKEGIINFGIKYMMLAFVVSVSSSIVSGWTAVAANSTWQQAMYMAFGACTLAYLCHHAPSVASSMSSGSGGGGMGGGLGMAGAMAGAIAGGGAAFTKTSLDTVRGKIDPKTGKRKGNWSVAKIRGQLDPKTGDRLGGFTGKGGVVDRATGMDVVAEAGLKEQKAAEFQQAVDSSVQRHFSNASVVKTAALGDSVASEGDNVIQDKDIDPPERGLPTRTWGSEQNHSSELERQKRQQRDQEWEMEMDR